ncbi:WSC domain-containing protein [Truncatella angustata]|uniref:WSC domain-containing protein n=1 Tax=Truncatella angustata TaxID=152316 RepID=A0A9P8ZYC8_9PEZI|nr:WSC domain-containing protein [Truncatella angustata]KAH6653915.1 WSC domain-containing protein [Truncatella angustata]
MTIDTCLAYCSTKGYHTAGLEYGRECWCGNALASGAQLDAGIRGNCSTPCAGDESQTCGGASLLSVYKNDTVRAASWVPGVGGYVYAGCYDEGKGRAVGDFRAADAAMTVDACVGICGGKGFAWAGLEYGQECWCARGLNKNAPLLSSPGQADQCTMQCAGNKGQTCGGSNKVSVYRSNGAQKEKRSRKRSLGPHATKIGEDGRPTVIKTVKMVRRGRFGRRDAFAA